MLKILFPPLLAGAFAAAGCQAPLAGGDPLDIAAPAGTAVGPLGASSDAGRDQLRHLERAGHGESGLRGSFGVETRGDF